MSTTDHPTTRSRTATEPRQTADPRTTTDSETTTTSTDPATSWVDRCQRQFDADDTDRLRNLADGDNGAMPASTSRWRVD